MGITKQRWPLTVCLLGAGLFAATVFQMSGVRGYEQEAGENLKTFFGRHAQPYSSTFGTNSRTGQTMYGTKIRHEIKPHHPNKQDSLFYLEGELVPPSAAPGDTTELAGLRLNMRMVDGTEPGAGIRSVHVTTTADGGVAKMRSLRTVTRGFNGHSGLINGVTFSATRSGMKPGGGGDYKTGDAGPYPNEDSAVTAQVGPGIRRVFVAEGFAGKERPQVAFLQKGGNQAVLPEIAVIQGHGGGKGDLQQWWNDEEYGHVVASLGRTGSWFAQSFRSNRGHIAIANGETASIPAPADTGFFLLWSKGSSSLWAALHYVATGAPVHTAFAKGGSTETKNGPLRGAQAAGGIIIAPQADQTFQVKNLTGKRVRISYLFAAGP
ncbi:MAG: hypothetical protein GY948_13245 [Alphaproteobacteria bacterium]|nr:hypothetical protein [Alphaproteobacteria bacterium]